MFAPQTRAPHKILCAVQILRVGTRWVRHSECHPRHSFTLNVHRTFCGAAQSLHPPKLRSYLAMLERLLRTILRTPNKSSLKAFFASKIHFFGRFICIFDFFVVISDIYKKSERSNFEDTDTALPSHLEITFALSCEHQLFDPKNVIMQAYSIFCAKNLHIRFFCSNFAADF